MGHYNAEDTMPEIRHRQQNAAPEIDYAEIHIPDDTDWGTGSFTTVFKPNSLTATKTIASIMFNAPRFQMSVTVNPNREVLVALGPADGSDPRSAETFTLTPIADVSAIHTLAARFRNWQVTGLELDGVVLPRR